MASKKKKNNKIAFLFHLANLKSNMFNLKTLSSTLVIALLAVSCQDVNESKSSAGKNDSSSVASSNLSSDVVKGVVKQSLQTTNYTYILFDINNSEQWVAVPSQQVKEGETYYFRGGLVMSNFESKELGKTFDKIIFLERLSSSEEEAKIAKQPGVPLSQTNPQHTTASVPDGNNGSAPVQPSEYKRTPPVIEKKTVKIESVKGGITIGELYKNKSNYSGKIVKIRGEVTKFTPAVMGKNWIHIQDGSENNGKFDLVVTSSKEVKVGDKITIEGKISLDKDLGYGYFFDVIIEDATVK
jgi:hypothetical protein